MTGRSAGLGSRLLSSRVRTGLEVSDGLDSKPLACRFHDLSDVTRVRCDNHCVISTDGTFDNGDIDDIVMVGFAGQLPDVPGLVRAHRIDVAASEHASQAGVAGTASPTFGHDGGGDSRYDLLGEESNVQRPHTAIVAVAGHESARVVGNPGH